MRFYTAQIALAWAEDMPTPIHVLTPSALIGAETGKASSTVALLSLPLLDWIIQLGSP